MSGHEWTSGLDLTGLDWTGLDLWQGALFGSFSLGGLARWLSRAPELRQTVVTADDITMIAHRSAWRALERLRPAEVGLT